MNVKKLLMISGGTGITPLYQIINSIINNKDDKTFTTLIYGNKGEVSQIINYLLGRYSFEGRVNKN